MLIYPFSQSVSLLMAMKGKQTVKHLQGLVHKCTNAAAVCITGRHATEGDGGGAGLQSVLQTGWAHRGGLNPLQCLFALRVHR